MKTMMSYGRFRRSFGRMCRDTIGKTHSPLALLQFYAKAEILSLLGFVRRRGYFTVCRDIGDDIFNIVYNSLKDNGIPIRTYEAIEILSVYDEMGKFTGRLKVRFKELDASGIMTMELLGI